MISVTEQKILKSMIQLANEKGILNTSRINIIRNSGFIESSGSYSGAFKSLREKGYVNEIQKNNYIILRDVKPEEVSTRKITTINKEEMYDSIKKLANNSVLDCSLNSLAVDLGYSSSGSTSFVRNLDELTKEKFIQINANEYDRKKRIVILNKDIEKIDNKQFNVNPQFTLKKIKEETFNNIKVKILESDIGKVIPIADIYNSLKIPRQNIHSVITSNKEIFEDKKIKMRCTNNVNQICLTKDGILALFMKIDYRSVKDEKRQLIIDFQNWAIEKLGELISDGKVELKDTEQTKAKNNIKDVLELSEDDVDKLFNDLENSLSNITSCLNNLKEVNKKRKKDVQKIEYDNTILKSINNKYRTKTMQLQERINNLKWS